MPSPVLQVLHHLYTGEIFMCLPLLDMQGSRTLVPRVVTGGTRGRRVGPCSPSNAVFPSLSVCVIGSDREEGKPFMPVLVLNSSLQPLSVIPDRRLIVLLPKQNVP